MMRNIDPAITPFLIYTKDILNNPEKLEFDETISKIIIFWNFITRQIEKSLG